MTDDEEFKKAVRAATNHILDQKKEHEDRQAWFFTYCPHTNTRLFVAPEYKHEVCENCGCERIIR